MNRTVIQRSFGGPEVLEVVDGPTLSSGDLAPGDVLVEVAFAGVNPVDAKTRAGRGVAGLLGDPPITVGWDLSGTVAAVGADVAALSVGDRVFGMSRFPHEAATYAQFAVVAADDLVRTPDTLGDADAAALPLAALTAWQQLVDAAGLQPGDRVLIHGAGGGVGHLAVQVAHHLGAHVRVTASAAKHEWLTALGADTVIDYATEDFAERLRTDPVDVVVDLVGGDLASRSLPIVKKGGVVLVIPEYLTDDLKNAAESAEVRVIGPAVHLDRDELEHVAELASSGVLLPTVTAVYALDDVAAAHVAIDSGHTRGKIVLSVA